ncbi:MAG: DEAD/DEAH box helicase [Lactobacillaceae bacterium]|nr:DEAD/DEAH box helicase [Lactobacillaceae bacterium]
MALNSEELVQILKNRDFLQNNQVLVFKGIDPKILSKLANKLISKLNADESIDEISKLDRTQMTPLLTKSATEQWCWLTYEEFTQIDNIGWSVPLFADKKIIVIENNLYSMVFPLYHEFTQVADVFQQISEKDDVDLPSEYNDLANHFFEFYEQISKVDNNYYIKYSDFSNKQNLDIERRPLFDNKLIEQVTVQNQIENDHDVLKVDLDASNDDFLAYIHQVLISGATQEIVAFSTSDANSRYVFQDKLRQLKILALQTMVTPKINVYKILPQALPLKHLAEYQALLKSKWGYDDFRELTMYTDPESGSLDKQLVSQARIIEDIVDQSEIALSGKVARDIFITAPTGAGKSVMFQLPALYLLKKHPDIRPLTLIVSPLIGLMNDQVAGMIKKGITNAKTINSAISPFEKQEIVEEVKNGQIDLLYLSPETLQNRSDISQIIGDRRIGLLIVDEAHTVVTWGKSFRADYWYLGLYLQKLRKTQIFPIVTFTATATVGGRNDMFHEIRNSLGMINPIKYIGNVKRDDISMMIKQMDSKGKDAVNVKAAKLLVRMKKWRKNGQKTLIYFPTVKLLNAVKSAIDSESSLGTLTRSYYGTMTPSDKENSYRDFYEGNALFMFATKAFGMGIDITDISNVYHYAPTGDVVDYVQEIGRVARDHKLVEYGTAYFDYIPQDFKYVKQLHGMSTIQEWQLKDAMKKILQLYKQNRGNRNLVISADDFKYVLELNDDDDNADNKLKIILLMLEKDFSEQGNYNYAPFVARPKQVFGTELVFIPIDKIDRVDHSRLSSYIEKQNQIGNNIVCRFNMADYWHKFESKESYPRFKYEVFNLVERQKHSNLNVFNNLTFATQIQISWQNYDGLSDAHKVSGQVIAAFISFLDQYAYSQKQFTSRDLAKSIRAQVPSIKSETSALTVVATLVNLCDVLAKSNHDSFIKRRVQGKSDQFGVNRNYSNLAEYIQNVESKLFSSSVNRIIDNTKKILTLYYTRSFGSSNEQNPDLENMLAYVGFLESLGLITFKTANGDNAQIYVRINNTRRMEKAISDPNYHNRILGNITRDYRRNVAMLEYLFKYKATGDTDRDQAVNYTKFFWNEIEAYFLGKVPEAVEKEI